MPDDRPALDMPPRAVLYGVYAMLFITLIAVLIIVGIYT